MLVALAALLTALAVVATIAVIVCECWDSAKRHHHQHREQYAQCPQHSLPFALVFFLVTLSLLYVHPPFSFFVAHIIAWLRAEVKVV